MADAIEGAAAGSSEAVTRFITHAQGYVGLLRQHIEKEDHCLFAMANRSGRCMQCGMDESNHAEEVSFRGEDEGSRVDRREFAGGDSGTDSKFAAVLL